MDAEKVSTATACSGQIWRDKDKRSHRRHVIVNSASRDGFVFYQDVLPNHTPIGRVWRSRYQRFQRAFEYTVVLWTLKTNGARCRIKPSSSPR